MVREKIARAPEHREIVYDESRWMLLKKLRDEARGIMIALDRSGLEPYVHGSIARGDVWEGSDIDVALLTPTPSYRVEISLESSSYVIREKYIVMATPGSTPKAYLVLDEAGKRVVSFPLLKLQKRESEFYYFSGVIELNELLKGVRVPGVDKRLVLIEPTQRGHRESPVIGFESRVAEVLSISIDTVLERTRVLTRRDEIGRTGVFIKHRVPSEESIEEALDELAKKNQWVRRVFIERS